MAISLISNREAPGGIYQDSVHTSTSFILSISLSVGLSFVIVCGLCWRRRSRNRRLAALRPANVENVPLQDVPRRKVLARNLLQSIPVIIWRAPRDPAEEGGGNLSMNEDTVGAKLSRASSIGGAEGQSPEGDGGVPAKNLSAPVTVIEMLPSNGEIETGKLQGGSRLISRSCSICTEDFVEGSIVRVLPCMHSYHTRCIDPWLLDFAGTCPICRTDFQNLESSSEDHIEIPQLVIPRGETIFAPNPAHINVPEPEPVPDLVSGPHPTHGTGVVSESALISIPAAIHVPAPTPVP